MTVRVRLLETVVAIRTDDPEADRLLELLWSAMRSDDGAAPDRTYELARTDEGWTVTADGALEAVHETLWGVADALRYQMLELCETRLKRYVSLHAAAVARSGDLVLLAGESGAGKTTLALALLDDGWSYLSDDLAPIEAATGLIHPFPKPLGLKDAGRWEAVRHAYGDLAPPEPPAGSFLVPPSAWTVAPGPLPPRALFLTRYERCAALAVEELTTAKAAALASPYLRRLDPDRVALLNRVCASAACFRLRYGSTREALEAIYGVL